MKILYVTTISLTMNSFFKPHVEALVKQGHVVDIACNYNELALDKLYEDLGCRCYQIDFSRSPLSINNLSAYKQLKKILESEKYDIVHCHTPNASVISRLVCRKFRKKDGMKVFYTAHGFHFYKGSPKLNWMIYYPVEKFCSRYTDKLITINEEDYNRAKKKFKAKEVCYIPGVGVDLSKFENVSINREEKRREIGIPKDAFLIFSVGELNENKNHQVVIKALAKINNSNIHYAIAGIGDKKEYLLKLAEDLGVSEQVHLLGYRNDIVSLYKIANVYVHSSFREGLPVSLMEALASGITVIASNIRGCEDIVKDNLFDPTDVDSLVEKLQNYSINGILVEKFSQKNVVERIVELHENITFIEYK